MTTEMIIAPARADQRDETGDLWRRTGLTRPYNDPRQDFEFALGKSSSDVLVGTIDGKIVASAMVGHDGHRGWVYYLAVDPALQRRGFGAQMMAAVEAWHFAKGVWKVCLLVRTSNEAVKGFYHALGYGVDEVSVLSKRFT